jgi:hypothetical protein
MARSRGLGDVYKRQVFIAFFAKKKIKVDVTEDKDSQ